MTTQRSKPIRWACLRYAEILGWAFNLEASAEAVGELTDWVFVFNASGKAPHVVRNLRGDIVFEGGEADVCVLHPASQMIGVTEIEDILTEKVSTVRLDSSPCPETMLQSFDVLIALRGDLLKQPPSYLAPLLGLIEDGTLQELKTLTGGEFANLKGAQEVEAKGIEGAILAGIREGYGLIKLENGSPVICMTTTEEEDAHRALLNEHRKLLLTSFKASPEIQRRTVDAAFIGAQRDKCGGIYASRSDLSDALQGFRRQNVPVSVIPLWFEPKLVANRADEMRRANEKLAQQEHDRKEELNLKNQQTAKQAHGKEARETKLRSEHGPKARARAEEIATAVKVMAEDNVGWANSEFPKLANWYRSRVADGWELVAINHEIADYGTADWKGRQLEVVFADLSVSMKNRVLGQKETSCFSLGLIFDTEFEIYREPFVEECQAAATPIRTWKQAQGFRGQWVAE